MNLNFVFWPYSLYTFLLRKQYAGTDVRPMHTRQSGGIYNSYYTTNINIIIIINITE